MMFQALVHSTYIVLGNIWLELEKHSTVVLNFYPYLIWLVDLLQLIIVIYAYYCKLHYILHLDFKTFLYILYRLIVNLYQEIFNILNGCLVVTYNSIPPGYSERPHEELGSWRKIIICVGCPHYIFELPVELRFLGIVHLWKKGKIRMEKRNSVRHITARIHLQGTYILVLYILQSLGHKTARKCILSVLCPRLSKT